VEVTLSLAEVECMVKELRVKAFKFLLFQQGLHTCLVRVVLCEAVFCPCWTYKRKGGECLILELL